MNIDNIVEDKIDLTNNGKSMLLSVYEEEIKHLQQENKQLKEKYLNAVSDYENEKSKNQKAIEYIESKANGKCIQNGIEKGAYTFVLDFDKAREFIWELLEILGGDTNE